MRTMWCVVAVVAAVALGCTGSEDDATGSTSTSTTGSAAAGADEPVEERPEGSWTMVRWLVETSDGDGPDLGEAIETRFSVTPSCDSGPCDLVIAPDGTDGSYRPPGVVAPADSEEPANELTLSWDPTDEVYRAAATETFRCRASRDEIVVMAERTITATLTYTPASGETPARLSGTWTEALIPTDETRVFGCPPAEATWTVAAGPVRAFDDAQIPLAGNYVVSASVVTADADGPAVGLREVLGRPTITGAGPDLAITGALGVSTPLALDATGWSGSATGPMSCTGYLAQVPEGATGTETWTGLRVIATTDGGSPVLSGARSLDEVPTAAAADSGCVPQLAAGSIVLVPSDEIR